MRKLILVRHGQYDSQTGNLTALGKRQARATVDALSDYDFDALHCSTMPRAQETARILKQGLRSRLKLRPSSLLRERLPSPVPGMTTRADLPELRENLATMRRAYARLSRPSRSDRTELVVAHGNLIRLFVCLALQVAPTRWLKMAIHNCSITVLVVKGDAPGDSLISFNERGHLPAPLRTYG